MKQLRRLRPGDLVEVRAPLEILQTLDENGALDGWPFMPEMIEFIGKRFRVRRRVLKTCISIGNSTNMRAVKAADVVILEGLRCSGVDHDGCQKSCAIFWREAWLRRVDAAAPLPGADPDGIERLRARLKTTSGPETYFCQASELMKVTGPMRRPERFTMCFTDVRVGNCSALEMAGRIGVWLYWRIRRILLGVYAPGTNQKTPTETLNLRSGELVEVKSLRGITETLDARAHNRGLYFTPDMAELCGRDERVERRLEKIIVDGTGQMRQMRNTVYLEGAHCGCSHVAFGGCPRNEYSYWREIWLHRKPERIDSHS